MIDKNSFLQIIDSTPLVSIDLILEDQQGRILLGKRTNRPAKGFWFVPGGRIKKNERLEEAIKRISSTELGTEINFSQAQLIGVFDHIYQDNAYEADGINTHYVSLGYKVKITDDFLIKPDSQHSGIKWWSKDALLNDSHVHQNTKKFFQNC